MKINSFIILFLLFTTSVFTQSKTEVCKVTSSFVDLKLKGASSIYFIDKFDLKFEEDEDEIIKLFHHKESNVKISVGVQIVSDIFNDKQKTIKINLSFTGKKDDTFDSLEGVEAETVYDKKWKWFSVSDNIKVKNRIYTFTLTCGKKKYLLSNKQIIPQQAFRFEDYPFYEIYRGKTAPLDIQKDDIWRERLQWAVNTQKVNFAGHYILANWSCGMWCSNFKVIDAKTGKVYRLDVSPQVCLPHLKEEFECNDSFKNIDFRINSKLLILFGIRYENNSAGERGFHYYKFENGKFKHLKSILTKEQRSARQIQIDEFDEKNSFLHLTQMMRFF